MWKIILSLKSQDDSMRDVLDNLRIELGRRNELGGRNQELDRIIFDLPENVINSIGESIKTILVTNTTEGWMETYGKLVEYVIENGNARVPVLHQTLGNWVGTQRSNYKAGKLSKERIGLLEGLNGWSWEIKNVPDWQDKFKELEEYVKHNSNASVPQSDQTLGNWVNTQRRSYNREKLSKEQITLLERLNDWSWDPYESAWQNNFEELEEYVKDSGNTNVHRSHQTLGSWIKRQRRTYKSGGLSKERIILLEGLNGWCWGSTKKSVWQDKFEELKKYVKENGNARVPISHQTLGKWGSKQRVNHKAGKLSKERVDLLNSLNGWSWDLGKK